MSSEVRDITSKKINANLANLLQKLNSQNFIDNGNWIGCFAPLPDEFAWFDGDDLGNYKFSLPHLLGANDMCFVPTKLAQIKQGGIGLELDHYDGSSVKPNLYLIPGLGFSRKFQRLGRGKGYYDKYLADLPSAIKVGICSEEQLLDELPTDEYDIEMNYIITDQMIYAKEEPK